MFILQSEYDSAGDQQQAIDVLVRQIKEGQERCVLLGVTGSGKTFAMAKIIERMQLPTLILSHNKTCLLYTSPSPRDTEVSRMPSSA